ncbi:MAG: beta-ketoacyl synthase N-terminal-like domain-containing protein, partial [Gammaproteobacteria bacterium]|nr:beta-ketoacyl synthase N-terminal-like domain-containing protein [Gammaproteobacteria bacterium]
MNETVIVGAARTPIGNLSGALSSFKASDLGSMAIHEALLRAQVQPEEVSDVIMGQVLTAGQGQNPARQAAIAAQIPEEKTAMTINQVCGSGLRAVALGHQAIRLGDSNVVVAGGQESMSQATHSVYMRDGVKMGDTGMVDTMISDGLWCAFGQCHMGITAENIAKHWKLSRETQDEFAARSQQKAEAAQKAGVFA